MDAAQHNTFTMNTIIVSRKQSLQIGWVKPLIGIAVVFLLAFIVKLLIDSFQQAEKAARAARETVSTIRTVNKKGLFLKGDKWIIPLQKHNELLKGTTIYKIK